MANIKLDDEDDDYWGIVKFDNDKEEKEGLYQYLWISEALTLRGMCIFLNLQ